MTIYPDTGVLSAPAAGTLLITNVRPYGEGEPTSLLIKDGVIEAIGIDITPAEGVDRTIDAIIGCLIAMAVIALVPQAPMSEARAEVSKVMGIVSSVLDDVATGLRERNPNIIDEALEQIRGTQTGIDDLALSLIHI